jgi:hypothetical protein
VKKELNPAVVWAILGVAALAVIIIGYRMLAPKPFVADTTGSEKLMEKVKSGEKMYNMAPLGPGGRPMGGTSAGGGAATDNR